MNSKNFFFEKGFLITIILSISVLFLFFGRLLIHPNSCYFSVVGDGIQVYYNALYHVFFDKNILTEDSMQYPYQESVFFTGCNPILTTFIKYLGLKYYTVGILNLSMLFSIPLAAIFIYLIFRLLTDGIPATDQTYSQTEFFDYTDTIPSNYTLEWILETPPSLHTYEELPYLVNNKVKRKCLIS